MECHSRCVDNLKSWHGRYGMREALAIVSAEGLPALWERHKKVHEALWKVRAASGLWPQRFVCTQERGKHPNYGSSLGRG